MPYRPGLASLFVCIVSLLALLGGCAPAAPTPIATAMPPGDHEAGRRDFQALGCALCHGAAGDRGIPAQASATPGPILGPEQAGKSTADLVESILNPSHRLPDSMAGRTVSPMPDYADITVRQLSDVVAYIHYLGE